MYPCATWTLYTWPNLIYGHQITHATDFDCFDWLQDSTADQWNDYL